MELRDKSDSQEDGRGGIPLISTRSVFERLKVFTEAEEYVHFAFAAKIDGKVFEENRHKTTREVLLSFALNALRGNSLTLDHVAGVN